MNRLGWSDAGVIVPWVVWKQFGDTQIIRLVTEPVGPLVIAILRAEGMMVILGLVDMIEIFLHRRPVLSDNLSVTKLLPDNPRHDNVPTSDQPKRFISVGDAPY